jgi:hypothetical protein
MSTTPVATVITRDNVITFLLCAATTGISLSVAFRAPRSTPDHHLFL